MTAPDPSFKPLDGGLSLKQWLWTLALLWLVLSPLILLQRDFTDGMTVSWAFDQGRLDVLHQWLFTSNWQLSYLYYQAVFALAHALQTHYTPIVKLILYVSMGGLLVEYFHLIRDLFGIARKTALWLALACASFPAWQILSNSMAVVFLVYMWAALVGHRLYRGASPAWRLAGLALMVFSFQLNSQLVFLLALEMVFLIQTPGWRRLPWFGLLLLCAIAYFAAMRLLFPPVNVFVDYNAVILSTNGQDLLRILRAGAMFLTWGAIPLLVVAIVVMHGMVRPRGGAESGKQGAFAADARALAFALFLAGAAVFPYAMVGKGAPLFTLLGIGQGVTEQTLRLNHAGWFAPTYSGTSWRHAFLLGVPLGLVAFFAARLAQARITRGRLVQDNALAWLILGCNVVWLMPAMFDKLEQQQREQSLINGLARLPSPPAGLVELQYSPPSDWLLAIPNAADIMRHAWGRADHLGMFYSSEPHHKDMQWQYHRFIKERGGLQSDLLQGLNAMSGFPGERCTTRYRVRFDPPSTMELLLAGWRPAQVRPADVQLTMASCEDANRVPNPTPDKRAIF